MSFTNFSKAIRSNFESMSNSLLFQTSASKDEMWEHYLASFPAGTNPLFKERTEHDCQCCKQFIRAIGNAVTIEGGKITTIWDVEVDDFYQEVAKSMSDFIKSKPIKNVYRHYEGVAGSGVTHSSTPEGALTWNHFSLKVPAESVRREDLIPSILAETESNHQVLERSLRELTLDSAEIVLELVNQNSIYRGADYLDLLTLFIKLKKEYTLSEQKDTYCWETSVRLGGVSKVRNTAIGSLLQDLSEGIELEPAVKSFETKLAPENYKRPTALVTASMISKAQDKVKELGFEASLARRFATTNDLTINNVLFADRSAKKEMNVFEEMTAEVPQDKAKLDKVEEVSIEDFVSKVLPTAESVELIIENRHAPNMVSLISPQDPSAPTMFKWDNNFSWSYAGEVADSMKQRVKDAGGRIDAPLRFSIQWNDECDNNIDFDAHCIEPNNNRVYFSNKGRVHPSSALLDVDIQSPGSKVAVENITFGDLNKIQRGPHRFLVHNYDPRTSRRGFKAELEFQGKTYTYTYDKPLKGGEYVEVAIGDFDGTNLKVTSKLQDSGSPKPLWGIKTETNTKVSMILNSPNHWDGNKTGNKHWFFMLEGCNRGESARGFFNEFLKEDLTPHRKVFEVLGSKMRAAECEQQLSGIGFSSTQRNSVYAKVTGKCVRTIKINL